MIPIKDDIPSRSYPFVTVSIIALNFAVFLYQLTLGPSGLESFIFRSAAIPAEISMHADLGPKDIVPVPFTLLTAIFVHGGVLHIAGNMLFLWIFGDNVEDRLGHFLFIAFYLVSGVAASMAHILVEPDSTIPMVGASGAIAGVLGAYFLFYPKAQVNTLVLLPFFVTVARIPAIIFIGFWFIFQVLSSGAAAPGSGGVAWFAHIGGFLAGLGMALGYNLISGPARGKRAY